MINQQANGNVRNMVAGDQHIHYYQSELSFDERQKILTELFFYRNQQIKNVHNILCDYAYAHFGNAKFTELTNYQLKKLYQYHQRLCDISPILMKRM